MRTDNRANLRNQSNLRTVLLRQNIRKFVGVCFAVGVRNEYRRVLLRVGKLRILIGKRLDRILPAARR